MLTSCDHKCENLTARSSLGFDSGPTMPDPPEKTAIPDAEDLISIASFEDIDETWVNASISYLEQIVRENNTDPTHRNTLKPQLVSKLNSVASKAGKISNLIRVLFRLVKTNASTKKLCEEVITAMGSKLNTEPTPRTFAQAAGNQNQLENSTKRDSTQLSVLPKENSEITLVPKNDYVSDLKKVNKSLREHQINSVRKSKAGNIVISCKNDDTVKLVEETLKTENFVEVKKWKNLSLR